MKRVTTILLLILFIYNFLGAGFVYNGWLYSIKKEVKERLKNQQTEDATLLKIPKGWKRNPPSDFQWHGTDEFQYRGQMFDIIRSEEHGDTTWYYCHRDEAETKLLNNLSRYVSNYLQQHPDEEQKNTFFKTHLDKTFLVSSAVTFLLSRSETITGRFKNISVNSIFLDVDSPPPQSTMKS